MNSVARVERSRIVLTIQGTGGGRASVHRISLVDAIALQSVLDAAIEELAESLSVRLAESSRGQDS